MAYSDYGAFVFKDGERRRDKEDVGVYDTDEANLPSGARIYANLIKNMDAGTMDDWWRHSQHGVMGDKDVRVACYKYWFPDFYVWKNGADAPTRISFDTIARANGWEDEEFAVEYDESDEELYCDWEVPYDLRDFTVPELDGYVFSAWHDPWSGRPQQVAWMKEPDGTVWECAYDAEYGAGFEF